MLKIIFFVIAIVCALLVAAVFIGALLLDEDDAQEMPMGGWGSTKQKRD